MNPLRFSVLKLMGRSPLHAKYALDHPEEKIDSPAMRLGRAVHAAFLGAQDGVSSIPIVFEGERRGNKWKEFKEANPDRDIVTSEEWVRIGIMASNLHAHREARTLLMGERERTLFFDFAGRPCRATPDVHAPGVHLVDVKTTQDASPLRFPYTATKLAYHAQLSFYAEGLKLAGFPPPKRVSIVAIETKPPFAVAVFELTPRALEYGERIWRGWMETLLVCEKSNVWPGYDLGVLDAPPEDFSLVGADGEELEIG
jgi:PDDEXK-like uncharacterized protein DUF3799